MDCKAKLNACKDIPCRLGWYSHDQTGIGTESTDSRWICNSRPSEVPHDFHDTLGCVNFLIQHFCLLIQTLQPMRLLDMIYMWEWQILMIHWATCAITSL